MATSTVKRKIRKGSHGFDEFSQFWCHALIGDGCWEWQKAVNGSGYPSLKIGGKVHQGNRLAYQLWKNEDLMGKLICHTCDNKLCIKPSHLYAGTGSDNVTDSYFRGQNRLKITPKQAAEIKVSSLSGRALAKLYGVCHETIRHVLKGRKVDER